MPPFRPALALLLATATALPAQTGRDLELTDEALPETVYRERFMGRYAAPGRCGSEEVGRYLILAGNGVQIGEILCEGIGKMTWEDDRLVLPLTTCRIDMEDQGPRVLTLERLTGGDLSVRSDAETPAVPNAVMDRCGP